MSLSVVTDVCCDAPGCTTWTSGSLHHAAARACEARSAAAKRGWTRRLVRHDGIARLVDLCPAHINEEF